MVISLATLLIVAEGNFTSAYTSDPREGERDVTVKFAFKGGHTLLLLRRVIIDALGSFHRRL